MHTQLLVQLSTLNQQIGSQKAEVKRISESLSVATAALYQLQAQETQTRKSLEEVQLSTELERLKQENANLQRKADIRRLTEQDIHLIRQRLLSAIHSGVGTVPQLEDYLCDVDSEVLRRELRYLASNPHSRIRHNGKRGRGSRYFWVLSD